MSALSWIGVGVAGWFALSILVGLLIGRVIRYRDEQLATDGVLRPSTVAVIGEPGVTASAEPNEVGETFQAPGERTDLTG